MGEEITIIKGNFNSVDAYEKIILRGRCPFCHDRVTFRARTYNLNSSKILKTMMVGIQCEGCDSILSYSVSENKIYPSPILDGLKGLPSEIEKYYLEGIRCIGADSPNGAVTLFRKVIHAIGIYYNLSKKDDDKNLYTIVKELHERGHIVQKIRDALLGIKDIGNDGAHINGNEPTLTQAEVIKELIDVVLNSTILCDTHIEAVKKLHKKE